MAKRFTATEKWEDKWFRELKPVYKCLWVYLLDRCDMAGVIEFDLDLAGYFIGAKIDQVEFDTVFKNRAFRINGSKLWIPKFIEFQYGVSADKLDPHTPIHRGVLKSVEKYGLTEFFAFLGGVSIGYEEGMDTLHSKGNGTGKGKGIETKERVIFKDGKLELPVSLADAYSEEFGRDRLEQQLPKMESWLKVNKPKKDYNRFVWNWLSNSRDKINGNTSNSSKPSLNDRTNFVHNEQRQEKLRNLKATLDQRDRERGERAGSDSEQAA